MLMSAGGFALYRAHLSPFEGLVPRFGSLQKRAEREKLLASWLHSKAFRRTGLDSEFLASRILNDCQSGGDFVRIVMESVAQRQSVARWAAYDPDNVLHIEKLKASIPNALFLHIIRDGRDIAVTLRKMGGFRPWPWQKSRIGSLIATALYWEWMVQNGREQGARFSADYLEIHYEELVTSPHESLRKVGAFLDHDLDYDRIRQVGLGRLSETNSSFRDEGASQKTNPIGRWKQKLSQPEVAAIEASVGECLQESGYELSLPAQERKPRTQDRVRRAFYRNFLRTKSWAKLNTPVGRLVDISALEIETDPISEAR